jgi:hypothetical protein
MSGSETDGSEEESELYLSGGLQNAIQNAGGDQTEENKLLAAKLKALSDQLDARDQPRTGKANTTQQGQDPPSGGLFATNGLMMEMGQAQQFKDAQEQLNEEDEDDDADNDFNETPMFATGGLMMEMGKQQRLKDAQEQSNPQKKDSQEGGGSSKQRVTHSDCTFEVTKGSLGLITKETQDAESRFKVEFESFQTKGFFTSASQCEKLANGKLTPGMLLSKVNGRSMRDVGYNKGRNEEVKVRPVTLYFAYPEELKAREKERDDMKARKERHARTEKERWEKKKKEKMEAAQKEKVDAAETGQNEMLLRTSTAPPTEQESAGVTSEEERQTEMKKYVKEAKDAERREAREEIAALKQQTIDAAKKQEAEEQRSKEAAEQLARQEQRAARIEVQLGQVKRTAAAIAMKASSAADYHDQWEANTVVAALARAEEIAAEKQEAAYFLAIAKGEVEKPVQPAKQEAVKAVEEEAVKVTPTKRAVQRITAQHKPGISKECKVLVTGEARADTDSIVRALMQVEADIDPDVDHGVTMNVTALPLGPAEILEPDAHLPRRLSQFHAVILAFDARPVYLAICGGRGKLEKVLTLAYAPPPPRT